MKNAAGPSILVAVVMLFTGVIMAEAQPASWTQPAFGGPFFIQVNDAFFRQSAPAPRGKTLAEGIFLFVDVNILNNSEGTLKIPRFTLQDSKGIKYRIAIRARRSPNAILGGESLQPGVSKRGYLIFDLPSLSGFESFPMRYKLQMDTSQVMMDVNVRKKVANE